jgi:hypothetical protein
MPAASQFLGRADIAELRDAIDPIVPDEVRVRPAPRLMRSMWNKHTGAMTLGKNIFVRPDLLESGGRRLEDLLVHELVHVRQWHFHRTIGFLGRYVRQYLMARFWKARHHVAYLSIDAEVEARRISSHIRNLVEEATA